jgi:hypothetical protein
MKMSPWEPLRPFAYAALLAASFQASQLLPQFPNRAPVAVGQKLADGQAYVTLVQLKHQANAADNGRILISFEENGMAGLPIYESADEGTNWQLVTHAVDTTHTDHDRCNLHWQPHLTELPRDLDDLKAGTLLLSASMVCNGEKGRMADQHLQLYTSTDLGRTWKYRSTIDEGTADLPVWEPNLQILDDGKLVTFYSSEKHKIDGYNQLLSHKVSTDAGKTWGAEVYDVAQPGGVERPGMAIVDRLADGRYVYTYEDVEGPTPNQVYIKFSRDGLHWGAPADRGTPIQTDGGEYPINCPVVRWLPIGGPRGALLVSARAAAGGGDASGRSLFWNTSNGEGPWWEVHAPVQKLMNGRSGWTQALMLKQDGSILHITSSASPDAINNASKNQILFSAAKLDLNRYEAEDSARQGSALMRDQSMSNGAKVRLGANSIGKLAFHINVGKAGSYALALHYSSIGFDSTPHLFANNRELAGSTSVTKPDDAADANRARDLGMRGNGDRIVLTATAPLKSGQNIIEVGGGPYALDVDYLEVTPQ